MLGLPEPSAYGPFAVLQFDNGATLDFIEDVGDITGGHWLEIITRPYGSRS